MDIFHPIVIGAHIVFAIAMIAVVLLQTGKGAGLSGVFGDHVHGYVACPRQVVVDAPGRPFGYGR
jgi:protein translocase SecG subunit